MEAAAMPVDSQPLLHYTAVIIASSRFSSCNLRSKGKEKEIVMKARPAPVCLGVFMCIALIVAACAIPRKFGPGVDIRSAVLIYPATQISSHDQKALDAILKEFNKSLYRIETYDRGRLVNTQGSLDEAGIDQLLLV